MRKLVPYTFAALLAASSTNAMMGANDETNVPNDNQNIQQNINKDNILDILEEAKAEIDKKLRAKAKQNFLEALALPDKIANSTSLMQYFFILPMIPEIQEMSSRYLDCSINSLSFCCVQEFRNKQMYYAQKEINKYKYQKETTDESYKNNSYLKKIDHYLSHLSVDISDRVSSNLTTVKLNAYWYKEVGRNVDLSNPQIDSEVSKWVKHTKQCSKFLKQENIQ